MKKLILTIVISVIFINFLNAQDLNSPAEIFKIMEKSKVSYSINILEKEIVPSDRSDVVNLNDVYRKYTDNGMETIKYTLSEEGKKSLAKAEEYYSRDEPTNARKWYKKVLETDPEYYTVMTYIGETFDKEQDFKSSIRWYEKTINKNYIDYMAHWFLADALRNTDLKRAVREITIAKILNRNNERINLSFNQIYELAKVNNNNWVFNPQIKIESSSENNVDLYYKDDWLGFAMVKAVWEYEPGYRESKGVKIGSYSTDEDKEALVALLSPMKKKEIRKNPFAKSLKKCFDNGMLNEYIFYEIVLPEYPFVAYQLNEDFIESIADYVIDIRSAK